MLTNLRAVIVEQLGTDALSATAREASERVDEARISLDAVRDQMRSAEEDGDQEEARIVMSEGYRAAGGNAETRKAWLTLQRREDDDWRRALDDLAMERNRVATAESLLAAMERGWSLAKLEMRMAIAQLSFLGGDS